MNNHTEKCTFPLVCIGLSKGAVEPLIMMFTKLRTDTGMAFVVLHHVRSFPTHLDRILAACTSMPVEMATSGMKIQPNHVYVLPSGDEMIVTDGIFRTRPRSKVVGWPNVVTVFLDSLAKSEHDGIAVILSGLDEDGAAALRGFANRGGITIVQTPESAETPDMPRAAIKTGKVNFVLDPVAIAGQLEKTARSFRS
jgi:two-component system, chemotaxis family, protein-glutamate methylesterase/glutaminase